MSKGRPKGKSLKEYSREYLAKMTDEERVQYLNNIDANLIWRMAEGNPHQTNEAKIEIIPQPIDDVSKDESIQEDKELEEKD